MPIPHEDLSRRLSLADDALSRYSFGASLSCLDAGSWDCDDPDDFTQVLTLERVDQTEGVAQASFHVRFARDGGLCEVYALDMASGSNLGNPQAFHPDECHSETLRERFGGTWGEHPSWPVSDWRNEVADDDTRLGYWGWVSARLEENLCA